MKKKKDSILPTNRVILGYKDVFGKSPEFNRIDILKKVSITDVVVELAGLNYRLKGQKNKVIDTTFTTQKRELFYFCGKNPALHNKYARYIDFKADGREVFIFSRQACLFALEEVIQSNLKVIDGFSMSQSFDSWEAILLYILCVNDEVTKIEDNTPNEPINFETLNPKLLPISELMLVSDPFYIVYRGWNLMIYLESNPETANHITNYFFEKYSISYERFIFELLRMWMANKHETEYFNFYYIVSENDPFRHIFDVLSEKYESDETQKLLNIRKNPFFKIDKKNYILTDITNLLEKAYYQFINDFIFDKLKQEERQLGRLFTMQDYKGIVGSFFEWYVGDKIKYSFTNSKNAIIRTFDQMIINNTGAEIECGDIYIRHENKVIFGEVKAGSLYDKEKYGGNIDAMYKNDRNRFFKNFGVDQLVNNIKNIKANIQTIDPEFSKRKKIRIWPIIVFNEKAFQTPFMSHLFNQRFKELMDGFKCKHFHVYPLTLIHVSDLETMECTLHKKPHLIWNLLTDNFRNPAKFIPPFYNTLDRNNIRANYTRFEHKVKILFDKFGGIKSKVITD